MADSDTQAADLADSEPGNERQRLDRWLWCARFFKSRSLAAAFCNAGRLRLSGRKVDRAHQPIRPGDVLTFPLGPHIRVVRVAKLAVRRGPATEARGLYEDLAPPAAPSPPVAQREAGAGRPSKADRRAINRLKDFDADDQ
jgi:ribosome-associated heat shock protein Hsp15